MYIYNCEKRHKQVELKFKPEYGEIGKLESYGNSYILVGFNNGKVSKAPLK